MSEEYTVSVLSELRREYAYTQRKLTLWLKELDRLVAAQNDETIKGRKRPTAEQILAVRERVYTLRTEIAALQFDLSIAVKECTRLGLALPADMTALYGDRTNVKPKS